MQNDLNTRFNSKEANASPPFHISFLLAAHEMFSYFCLRQDFSWPPLWYFWFVVSQRFTTNQSGLHQRPLKHPDSTTEACWCNMGRMWFVLVFKQNFGKKAICWILPMLLPNFKMSFSIKGAFTDFEVIRSWSPEDTAFKVSTFKFLINQIAGRFSTSLLHS